MKKSFFTALFFILVIVSSCRENDASGSMNKESNDKTIDYSSYLLNKGIGPISNLELSTIDYDLVDHGKKLYKTYCVACHKLNSRSVGPAIKGITQRRSPEWIMNMILNPDEMIEKDSIAMELLEEYSSPMINQNITQEESRALLEFFRTKN